jgi:broad specificity phosphatase PhoE
MKHEIWLVRHGETAWSLSGQHTGWTDLELTPEGEQQALGLGSRLDHREFRAVFSSPLARARKTCELAGYGGQAVLEDDLREWNYGSLEGKTAHDIRRSSPDWTIWTHGTPDGESIEQVYERAGRVIAKAGEVGGDVLLFAHGHLLRILACCYLGLPARDGRLLALGTASISVLGWEKETRVIRRWNLTAE